MELLRLHVEGQERLERMVWLAVRQALDSGNSPEEVAVTVQLSVPSMYRRLREQGLTYGRGRVRTE